MRQPDAPTSVLGPDITIIGQQLVLKTKGSLLIAGQIQGDVHGESVTVGESGAVTGTITARTIAVQGEVRGALKGGSVFLHATSRVDGDIVKQTKLSLKAVKYILQCAGSSLDRVASVRIYCSNSAYFPQINEVYKTYFAKDPPSRTFVTVGSWPMAFDIEIECVALAD